MRTLILANDYAMLFTEFSMDFLQKGAAMKIDRLVGILSVLLQKDNVSAPCLAEKFEVSRRTINRDIEDLCKAGIPIVTRQGANGGISIMDHFKIDKILLTNSDMQAILAGLKSLDSVSGTNRYRTLMEKISADGCEALSGSHIMIDLSGWDRSEVSRKIEILKAAIENRTKVTFQYISPGGEGKREAEPCQIVFQWSNWYLWAYCTRRQDYRMFKLSRMTGLEASGEIFEKRENCEYTRQDNWNRSGGIKAAVRFDKSAKWKVIDDFGADRLQFDENGNILIHYVWQDKQSFLYHILSFGDKAEILEPVEYRGELAEFIERILKKYHGT